LNVVERDPSTAVGMTFLMSRILNVKGLVAEKVNQLWHEPHASFMAGLLYGYRGGLGSLNEAFNRTGVTHIIAISGYNISIVASILFAVLVKGFWINRKKAFWGILIGIGLFVLFTGASASVVRAGIMGSLVLLARQLGRQKAIANVLALTALLMTLHNPFVLLWDAGFQLSFVAVVGLIYLAPLLAPKFEKIPEAFGLRESVVSTLSAIIATLPLIAYQFGRVSLVALPANILILWLIPFLMMLGFLAVMLSFIFMPVAQVIAWIAWAGLSYIILVVKWLSGLGFASVSVVVPFVVVLVLYGMFVKVLFLDKTQIARD
jgi:competence protein ComEC